MRRIVFSALTVCGLALLGSDLRADDSSPFQLLGSSQVSSNQSVEVTPVRWGYGWRGPGYYPGITRPFGYNYNYNRPYWNGYGSYYRGYYGARPYYNSRPYYGYGYYR